MRLRDPRTRSAIFTAAIIAAIVYGSLSPFNFEIPDEDVGAVRTLLASWADGVRFSDFVLNTLAYIALGVTASLCFGRRTRARVRVAVVTLGGALLSVAMELTQYYEPGRVTAASDVYSNTLGTLIGSLIVVVLFRR